MSALPEACARVLDAAGRLGLSVSIRRHEVPTRTAAEAASACGCPVGAIVKSLVFAGTETGTPVLLLVSGDNRVDETRAAAAVGEAVVRPDAKAVRAWTGFAIGGIPPFGHATALRTFLDEDLLAFDPVWAAAGTPNSVFAIDPRALARATGAAVTRLA